MVSTAIYLQSVSHQANPWLEQSAIGRLTKAAVLITAHFHPNRLQNLFHSHVTVPVAHGGQFVEVDVACFGINAIHVNFGNKTDIGWDGGVIVGTM